MALANEPPDATARPGPSRMTDMRRQDLDDMDFLDSTANSLSTPNGRSEQNAATDSQNQVNGAWQAVLTLRQKKSLAKEKAKSMDFPRPRTIKKYPLLTQPENLNTGQPIQAAIPPCPKTTSR
ncbi:hypothetical protein MRX96_057321 [Rhipicephalus microplus]